MALGCCKFLAALLLVPLAIVLSALLEKPVVTELSSSVVGKTAEAPAEPAAAAAASGAASQAASRSDDSFGKATATMGSGNMFDRIAFVYDSTNKWMSLGLDQFWRRTLIQECMRLEKNDKVLDLATGTADVSILAGTRLRELGEGAVMGLDPSSEMLRRGVSKVEQEGLAGVVRLVKGDAQNLSSVRDIDAAGTLASPTAGVASGSIDKISMSFGIRNVPERKLALREMRRVLRSRASSRVCILEFSLPDGRTLLSKIAHGFITHVVPFIGRVATLGKGSVEYEYLERSILKFPQPLDFAKELGGEGLPVLSITSFAFGAVHLYTASPALSS